MLLEVWGKKVRGTRNGIGESPGIVRTDFLLTLPFSDSWLSGSLGAASSEGGVDAESDSFFARATGMTSSEGRRDAWLGRA